MTKTHRLLLLLLLLTALTAAQAQTATTESWQQVLSNIMTLEDEQPADWEELMTQMEELAQQPRDINRMTRHDWEELPFLTPLMVEQLVEYRDRYGTMKSMNELRLLTALDEPRRQLLCQFFFVGDDEPQQFPSLDEIVRYGHHELMAYARVPTYHRKGDRGAYAGSRYKHWLRYQFNAADHVRAGLVASQDAGEPFFKDANRAGYDFYSFYLQVNNWRRVETAVVGKYKVSAGLGLVVNNGFSLGKLAMLSQLGRSVRAVRPHSSRSTDYMQGSAATIGLSDRLALTAFVSYRPLDATLNDDGTVRTLLTDGYHRTATELAKKNNTHAAETGLTLRYHHRRLHAGFTALYSHLDRQLQPPATQRYRRYDLQGNDFLNASIDYSYLGRRLTVSGETAVNRDGALATLNSATFQLSQSLSLLATQRFYSYRYTALHARALSNGSQVQNESGVLAGLTWTPTPRWRLMGYSDYCYSPWARYRISQSSTAWDHLLQLSFSPRHWTLGARYRLRQRQRDQSGTTTLETYREQHARLWADWQDGTTWTSRTQVDASLASASDRGVMVSQNLGFQHGPLRLNGGLGYFHTDSYDSRVYLYETGPLYTFGVSQFYGRGWRYWLMARWQPTRRLLLTAKVGTTHYQDRDVIGSGQQQVDASSMTDIDLQLKWRF
jgi:hypothetical protein